MGGVGPEGRSIADRVAEVRGRIAGACQRAGRDPGAVKLVAASKDQAVEALLEAWRAGVRCFGENRVQEASRKRPLLPAEAEWHLLGPLQSNKARAATELFSTLHAVDRTKIARALDRHARSEGRRLTALLEVNLGQEPTKHGFAPGELVESAAPLADLEAVRIVGLMAIPPFEDDPEASRPWFRRLRELADELARRPEWKGFPGQLSMGMSHDFEVAIEEGATLVRVGTALFGPRPGA
jgi:PLP dependent protein